MLSRVFSLNLLNKRLNFDSSLITQDNFLIISANDDFSGKYSQDNQIYDFLTRNSLNKIRLTSGVSEIYQFYGVHIVKIFDFSDSLVSYIPENMFVDTINLEEVILNENIKSIDGYAFGNSAISKINLEHVKTIGAHAFSNCQNLKNVNVQSFSRFEYGSFRESGIIEFTFPKSINTIQYNMFENCHLLTKVNLSSTITTIGKFAFSNCYNLETVEGISQLTSIGANAFEFCSLKYLKFEKDTVTCFSNAFANNAKLTSVGFVSVSLEKGVFMNCINLKTVTITNEYRPNNQNQYNFYNCILLEKFTAGRAYTIGICDFANCRKLANFDVQNIRELEEACFRNCQSLTSFNLTNMDYIGSGAFQGCTKLKTVYGLENQVKPNRILKASVGPIQIGPIERGPIEIVAEPYVFSDCISLEFNQIHYANTGMFSNCYSLKEINFTGQVLESKAFQFCINLKKFNFIPVEDSIFSIPEYCFYGCVNLEEINFPDNIHSIGKFAFYNTSLINGININKVQNLGACSFAYSKLTSITFISPIISKYMHRIVHNLQDLHIFDHCDMLEKVIFEGKGFIPLFEFKNCKNLNKIEFKGDFQIKDDFVYAIEYTNRLVGGISENPIILLSYNISANTEGVIIPEKFDSIYYSAFRYVNNIKTLKVNYDLQIMSYAFADMESLEEVYFNASEIPFGCFYNCTKLSKVTLSENVKIIDENAFSYTNINEIVLPLSLEYIANPFRNTPIVTIEFTDGQFHPDFFATKNEFIRINHDKNDEMEILFIFGNISNQITKLTEGVKSLNMENFRFFSDDKPILMLPHSIERIVISDISEHYSGNLGSRKLNFLNSIIHYLILQIFIQIMLRLDESNSGFVE